MREVGLALLGLGRAGSFHLESIRSLEGARLRCVYDLDGARAADVAHRMRCRAARETGEAVGADDVEGVIVATPTPCHHRDVVTSLEAGKAVLSEKPLGTDLAQIERCYALATERGQPLLVAFQRRFDPSFAEAARAARAGELGQLQFVRSVSRDSPLPSIEYIRTSCGIFHDCVVHDLDLVCQLTPEVPDSVFAFASSFVPEIGALGDVDNVAVLLRFPSGLLGSIDVNRNSAYGYDQRLEVFGRRGMLQVDNQPRLRTVRSGAAGSARGPIDHSFPTRYGDAYRRELESFLGCIRKGRPPAVTREEVLLNHRLASAAERSLREERPVRLAETEGGDALAPGPESG